jgi:hypothetical protein
MHAVSSSIYVIHLAIRQLNPYGSFASAVKAAIWVPVSGTVMPCILLSRTEFPTIQMSTFVCYKDRDMLLTKRENTLDQGYLLSVYWSYLIISTFIRSHLEYI